MVCKFPFGRYLIQLYQSKYSYTYPLNFHRNSVEFWYWINYSRKNKCSCSSLLDIRKRVNHKQNVNILGEIKSLTKGWGPCGVTCYFSHRMVERKAGNTGISLLTQTKTICSPILILLIVGRWRGKNLWAEEVRQYQLLMFSTTFSADFSSISLSLEAMQTPYLKNPTKWYVLNEGGFSVYL